jgi:hypothetical protein
MPNKKKSKKRRSAPAGLAHSQSHPEFSPEDSHSDDDHHGLNTSLTRTESSVSSSQSMNDFSSFTSSVHPSISSMSISSSASSSALPVPTAAPAPIVLERWEVKMLRDVQQSHAMYVAGIAPSSNSLILIGGRGEKWTTDQTSVRRINISTGLFSRIESCRIPALVGHRCVAGQSKICVFGGMFRNPGLADHPIKFFSSSLLCDLQGTTVNRVDALQCMGTAPSIRAHHTCTLDETQRCMFLLGGFERQNVDHISSYSAASSSSSSDVMRLAPFNPHMLVLSSYTWVPLSLAVGPSPASRYGHSCVAYGGYLYIWAGASRSKDGMDHDLRDMWRMRIDGVCGASVTSSLNVASVQLRWEQVQQLGHAPPARRHHATIMLHGRYMLILGGVSTDYTDGNKELTPHSSMYVCDMATHTWHRVVLPPTASIQQNTLLRFGHVAVALPNDAEPSKVVVAMWGGCKAGRGAREIQVSDTESMHLIHFSLAPHLISSDASSGSSSTSATTTLNSSSSSSLSSSTSATTSTPRSTVPSGAVGTPSLYSHAVSTGSLNSLDGSQTPTSPDRDRSSFTSSTSVSPVAGTVDNFSTGYVKLTELGHGANATVTLIYNDRLKQRFALRETKQPLSPSELRMLSVICDMRSHYTVTIFHMEERKMIMELMDQGSLGNNPAFATMRTNRSGVLVLLKYVLHLARALNDLHSHSPPIVHRDVKPENVLLSSSAHGLAKLGDFDKCAFESEEHEQQVVGSMLYLSPEALQGKVKCCMDIFSFGCAAIDILSGQSPLLKHLEERLSRDEQMMRLAARYAALQAQATKEGLESVPEWRPYESPQEMVQLWPAGVADLISQCTEVVGAKRPTAKELVLRLDAAVKSLAVALQPR